MAEVICVGVAVRDHLFEADLPASSDSKTFARTMRSLAVACGHGQRRSGSSGRKSRPVEPIGL